MPNFLFLFFSVLWCHSLTIVAKCVKTYAHIDQKLHMCKTLCKLTLINMATVRNFQALLDTLKRDPIEDLYLKEPK
jgi:hypothetical protein